jgi:hypothetical protein
MNFPRNAVYYEVLTLFTGAKRVLRHYDISKAHGDDFLRIRMKDALLRREGEEKGKEGKEKRERKRTQDDRLV